MQVDQDQELPLRGYRLLEISSRPAGAYCGWLLAQLGAEVTRLDLAISGDIDHVLQAEYEAILGSGKRIIPADMPGLEELVSEADLIVTDSLHDDPADGTAHRVAKRLSAVAGCDVVDIAGHLEVGTAGEVLATTPLTVSARGAMSWALGHPDKAPITLPVDLPDHLCGAEAAGLACLALFTARRERHGDVARRYWSVTGTEALAYYVGQICANFIPYERPWHRDGARASMSGGSYPAAMFECKDGHVSIMCRTSREWHALLRAMGDPPWSHEERFRDPRVVAHLHSDEADKHLRAWTATRTRQEVFSLGTEFAFPVAPVLTVAESLGLGQFAERGSLRAADELDNLQVPSAPWRFSGTAPPGDPSTQDTLPLRRDVRRKGPLAGLRVLDLSWVWSGPMVTAALSDLGAEIIKIENRKRADPARLRGRARRNGSPVEGPELEVTPYFNQMNRGKESVAVDISTDSGRALILDLVEHCDVVVENMRPGALERRGLGYGTLAERNPAIVMLSMSIMGQTGSMRGVGGYAPVMSGLAGLDSLVGYGSGDLIGLYNPALGDPNGAAHAMASLLAALVRREQSRTGAWIDLSQVEALVAALPGPILESQRRGCNWVRGNAHAQFWPHGTFRSAGHDRWVSVSARTDAERSRLAAIIGIPPGSDRGAFETALSAWAATRTNHVGAAELIQASVPASAVWTYEEVLASHWVRDRELVARLPHPYLGMQPVFNVPWKCDGAGFPARICAPVLGADTDSVLGRLLGLKESDLAQLRQSGAIE